MSADGPDDTERDSVETTSQDGESYSSQAEAPPPTELTDASTKTMPPREDHGRPRIPREIGGYRILRKLGEGGMGVVYEGEQQHPRRPVAIKVIRGAYVDETVARMFEREAQVLARLKHPGIAPVYEVGRTDDGQRFFAMELVRGDTLSDFLRGRPSPAKSRRELEFRLRLFQKICDAVSYAHQRGVIHRDLKPGNMMVPRGGSTMRSVPSRQEVLPVKILDFGMARITDTDVSMVTEAGRIQGTLAYMSPEQARGNPDEIDLRSDIYSLGVVLHKMLTGHRPYETRHVAMAEAIRVICEEPPRSLSASLEKAQRFDRDLETIVRTALEKDPAHRYQSVAILAGDVARYLARQPIVARRPHALYQMRMLIRRHKLGFAFVVTVFALLVVLVASMTVQTARVAEQRDSAERAFAGEKHVTEFLTKLFEASSPEEARGESVSAREILDRGSEQIREDFDGRPEVKAKLLTTLGRVYTMLGEYDEARPLLESALRLRTSAPEVDELAVAESQYWLAWHHDELDDFEEAEPLFRQALDTRTWRLGKNHPLVMESLITLGALYYNQGELEDSERRYREAITIAHVIEAKGSEGLAAAYNNLGAIRSTQGSFDEAVSYIEKALSMRESLHGPDHPQVATTLNNLGEAYRGLGRLDEAIPLYQRSLELRRKLYGPDHIKVAVVLNNVGTCSVLREDYDEAETYFREALEIIRDALGHDNRYVAVMLSNLGDIELRRGRPVKAELHLRPSLEIMEKALEPNHPDLATTKGQLGIALTRQQRFDLAEAEFLAALQILEEASASHPSLADVLDGYAECLAATDRSEEAADAKRRAQAIREVAEGH